MTDERIDVAAIRELLGKGTLGPWAAYFTVHGDPFVVPGATPYPSEQIAAVSTAPDDYGRANAEAIVALVNNAPALLDAYEREGRLREALEEARQWLDSLPFDCNDDQQMGALAATQRRIREALGLPVRSLLGEGER